MPSTLPPPAQPSLPTIPQLERPYRCPDRPDGVTEAVHQARLAAGDDRCYGCPHRPASGDRPEPLVQFNSEGQPRGRFRRELTPDHVGAWIDTLGHELATAAGDPDARPRLAFAQDDRIASAQLAGLIERAARHGVDAIDLGTTTRPVLEHGVRQLGAAAGLMLTAGDRKPGWAGVDVLDAEGQPQRLPDAVRTLTPAAAREWRPLPRASRITQPVRPFDAAAGYRDRLLAATGLDQSGRPVRLAVAGGSGPVRELAADLLAAAGVGIVSLQGGQFEAAVRLSRDGRAVEVVDQNAAPVPAILLRKTLAMVMHDSTAGDSTAGDRTGRSIAVDDRGRLMIGLDNRASRDGLLAMLLVVARLRQDDCPASISLRSV